MQSQANVIEMIEMRKEGMSLSEIGKQFGISRQRVYQIIGGEHVYPGRPLKNCVFPGITNWLRERSMPVKQFADNLHYSRGTLYLKLWGKHTFTLNEIKEVLAYTGMTFEEAFGAEIKPTEED